jgi:hypothetical protein
MQKKKKVFQMRIISIILSFAMLIALFDLPYSYYELLRALVFFGGMFLVYSIYNIDGFEGLFIFIFIGMILLWNPIFPVYMSRSSWAIFNVFGVVSFGYFSYEIGK